MTDGDTASKVILDRVGCERTLGQVILSLPFRAFGGNSELEVAALPDDVLPSLEIPDDE